MITAKSSYVEAYAQRLLATCRLCLLRRDFAGAARTFAVLLKQVRRFPVEIAELGLLLLGSRGDFADDCGRWVAEISRYPFVQRERLLLQYIDYLLRFDRSHAAYDALQLFLVSRDASARAHYRAGELALRKSLGLPTVRLSCEALAGEIDTDLRSRSGEATVSTDMRRLWLHRAVTHLEKAHELDKGSLLYAARLVEALAHSGLHSGNAVSAGRAKAAAVFRVRRAVDFRIGSADECVDKFQRLAFKANESARQELLAVALEVWRLERRKKQSNAEM